MRSAPPLQVGVTRFGVWRAIVALLAGSACASLFLWWRAQPLALPPWVAGLSALALLAAIAAVAWRMPPLTLRWDRQRWWVARGDATEQPGELAVAIDLGGWLLLRFVADATPGLAWRWRRSMWVALQRPGLEPHWHGLRCALYAARPGLPAESAAAPAKPVRA